MPCGDTGRTLGEGPWRSFGPRGGKCSLPGRQLGEAEEPLRLPVLVVPETPGTAHPDGPPGRPRALARVWRALGQSGLCGWRGWLVRVRLGLCLCPLTRAVLAHRCGASRNSLHDLGVLSLPMHAGERLSPPCPCPLSCWWGPRHVAPLSQTPRRLSADGRRLVRTRDGARGVRKGWVATGTGFPEEQARGDRPRKARAEEPEGRRSKDVRRWKYHTFFSPSSQQAHQRGSASHIHTPPSGECALSLQSGAGSVCRCPQAREGCREPAWGLPCLTPGCAPRLTPQVSSAPSGPRLAAPLASPLPHLHPAPGPWPRVPHTLSAAQAAGGCCSLLRFREI